MNFFFGIHFENKEPSAETRQGRVFTVVVIEGFYRAAGAVLLVLQRFRLNNM